MKVKVFAHVGGPVLFSRGSARKLEHVIAEALAEFGDIELDFEGVKTMTPSFFDELLWVLEDRTPSGEFRVILRNSAEPLDRKFEAVAAGHALTIRASGAGEWLIERLRVA